MYTDIYGRNFVVEEAPWITYIICYLQQIFIKLLLPMR